MSLLPPIHTFAKDLHISKTNVTALETTTSLHFSTTTLPSISPFQTTAPLEDESFSEKEASSSTPYIAAGVAGGVAILSGMAFYLRKLFPK